MSIPDLATSACFLAQQGHYIFPCAEGGKRPMIQGWQLAATRDGNQIDKWWTHWPRANIGCVPGLSGHIVIDVDVKGGKPGLTSLAELETRYGPLPDTLVIETPSGGFHIWLNGVAPSSAGKLGPGLDVRSLGGYVLLPPSIIDGKRYKVREFEASNA